MQDIGNNLRKCGNPFEDNAKFLNPTDLPGSQTGILLENA